MSPRTNWSSRNYWVLKMQSKLEKRWWFLLPVSAVAALLTHYLMDSAAITRPYNFSQWALYVLCFASFQRGLSFLAWLVVLVVSPSEKVLARTKWVSALLMFDCPLWSGSDRDRSWLLQLDNVLCWAERRRSPEA